MNKIKEFLSSKWVYRLTDNQMLAFEAGIVAMSMGSAFLFMSVFPSVGGIKEIIVASAMLVVGLIIVVIISNIFFKTREEIK